MDEPGAASKSFHTLLVLGIDLGARHKHDSAFLAHPMTLQAL